MVVTGGHFPGALAAVRSLRRAGFSPVAVTSRSGSYVAFSAAVSEVVRAPDVTQAPEAFARSVAASCTGEPTILIPGTEPDLVALVEWADRLPAEVRGLPLRAILERATNKLALAASAEKAGFSALPAAVVRRGESTTGGTFPCVVKPVHSVLRRGDRLVSVSAVAVASQAALEAALDRIGDVEALVQPLVRGRLHSLAGVMWSGRLLAPVQQVALSIYPRPCGGSAVARTQPVDSELHTRTERLLNSLGWQGIVQVQWLDDGARRYVIDVNPRIYGSLALANAAGCELAVVWTRLLLGDDVETASAYRDVLYRNLETCLRAGGISHLWTSTAHGATSSVFAASDPLPVLGSVVRSLRKAKRLLRRLGRRAGRLV